MLKTPSIAASEIYMDEWGPRIGGMLVTGEKRLTGEKPGLSAIFYITNLVWKGVGLNPNLRGERPSTNPRSHGTVLGRQCWRIIKHAKGKFCGLIYVKILSKTTKCSNFIFVLPTEMRTGHLHNKSLDHFHFSKLPQWIHFTGAWDADMAAVSWPDRRSRTRPLLAARLGDTGGRGRRVQRADEVQQHNEEEEIRHDSDDSVRHSGKWSFQTSQH